MDCTEQDQWEFAAYVEDLERVAEARATPPGQRTAQQWAELGWTFGPPVGFEEEARDA